MPGEPETGPLGAARDLLGAGGPVVAILLLLSVVALAVSLAKLFQFHRMRLDPDGAAEIGLTALRQGQPAHAIQALRAGRGVLPPLLMSAVEGLRGGQTREAQTREAQTRDAQTHEAKIREEAERLAAGLLETLRSHLRLLEVIAALSPLLGLLGTVLGMIEAFQQMEAAGSRVEPSVLSGGIWEALLTTAVGLAVAIPSVAAFNGFERHIERMAHGIEDALTRVFTAPLGASDSHDSLAERPRVQAAS